MTIHLETTIPATPEQVYGLLTDGAAFGKATGMPGYGGTAEGEFFSVHDGNTVGRQVELIPGERVVQAMRLTAWEPGVWSLLTFTMAPAPEGALAGRVLAVAGVGRDDDRLHAAPQRRRRDRGGVPPPRPAPRARLLRRERAGLGAVPVQPARIPGIRELPDIGTIIRSGAPPARFTAPASRRWVTPCTTSRSTAPPSASGATPSSAGTKPARRARRDLRATRETPAPRGRRVSREIRATRETPGRPARRDHRGRPERSGPSTPSASPLPWLTTKRQPWTSRATAARSSAAA